jgi:peptidyl-prolyl cis-trans isomerase B (cyclophilin B)
VAGSAKRERQLAREHYERQQARRQETAARRRKLQQGGAIVLAVALVIGGVVALALALNGNEDTTVATEGSPSPTPTSEATPSPSPSATEGAGCTYSKTGEAAAKDVGVPAYDESRPEQYAQPFTATLATNRGNVTIEMAAAEAPCTTNSFRHLAEKGYFDGTSCHRLTTSNIFVLQCGDPTGSGSGGPGYQFGEENLPGDAENNYPAGTVAMANAGPGTNGSQFFLVYDDTTLPPDYTIFGTVTKGLDVVKAVADAGVEGGGGDGTPAKSVTIENVRIAGEG